MIVDLELTNDDQIDYQGCRVVEISKLRCNTPILSTISSELVINSKPRFRFQEATIGTISFGTPS